MDKKIKGYIICESATDPETPIIISDNKNENDHVIIKTTLQDSDVGNRNKRMYPKSVLTKGLASDYVRERLATKTWFGEAGKLGWSACKNNSLIAG